MKKFLAPLIAFVLMAFMANAQNAKSTVIDFNKKSQTAVSATYPMPAAITEGALRKKMSEAGLKGGNNKDGFLAWQGIQIPSIWAEKMDVYFKIMDESGSSTVYMLTSTGYENFMNKESNPEVHEKVINWMNEFSKDVMRFGYQDDITKNENKLKDLEKDLKKAVKNGASLAKDKTKSEGKAAENKQTIAQRKAEVDNQNKTLEFVKAKTGTVDQMDAIKKEIGKQEDAVKKANKSYQNAMDDDEDYKKDIEKASVKIGENETEQAKIRSQIDQVKSTLADLKGKLGAIK
jgi:hypothetical protein